jgi:hypothetical protein
VKGGVLRGGSLLHAPRGRGVVNRKAAPRPRFREKAVRSEIAGQY